MRTETAVVMNAMREQLNCLRTSESNAPARRMTNLSRYLQQLGVAMQQGLPNSRTCIMLRSSEASSASSSSARDASAAPASPVSCTAAASTPPQPCTKVMT